MELMSDPNNPNLCHICFNVKAPTCQVASDVVLLIEEWAVLASRIGASNFGFEFWHTFSGVINFAIGSRLLPGSHYECSKNRFYSLTFYSATPSNVSVVSA